MKISLSHVYQDYANNFQIGETEYLLSYEEAKAMEIFIKKVKDYDRIKQIINAYVGENKS